jgi:hypothetical protein
MATNVKPTARTEPVRGSGSAPEQGLNMRGLLVYVLLGAFFGIVLVKSEVVSWFRIQEMFRFQSFHMYGVIGSAVAVAALSVWLIKKFRVKTLGGEEITRSRRSSGGRGHATGRAVRCSASAGR